MIYLQNQECTGIIPFDSLLKISKRDGINKKRYTLELNCHELANYSTEEEAKKALEYVYKRINLGCAIVQLPK